jgi:hypothetical protein
LCHRRALHPSASRIQLDTAIEVRPCIHDSITSVLKSPEISAPPIFRTAEHDSQPPHLMSAFDPIVRRPSTSTTSGSQDACGPPAGSLDAALRRLFDLHAQVLRATPQDKPNSLSSCLSAHLSVHRYDGNDHVILLDKLGEAMRSIIRVDLFRDAIMQFKDDAAVRVLEVFQTVSSFHLDFSSHERPNKEPSGLIWHPRPIHTGVRLSSFLSRWLVPVGSFLLRYLFLG